MSRRIVLLGMMGKMPVPGVVWQTAHYLLGFRALGFEPYYVEAHARVPSMLMERDTDDAGRRAAEFIARVMKRFDLGDAWAYHALHDEGHPCYGMSEARLRDLYREAELIVNLHGGTEPRPEHYETGRLVYLQTDPVELQIELHDGVQESYDFLAPHAAFFTFAENLGRPGCELPVSDRFDFRPTRQPVVCDLWNGVPTPPRDTYTTIGNWRQPWREIEHGGRRYSWSKDREWPRFLDLPRHAGPPFELALSSYTPGVRTQLEARGWSVRHALDFGEDTDAYRAYVAGSRGEFTVAKEQNVRFRTGWFSDRSATYLASGRPVVTQDTAFGCVLPTGEGLFGVSDLDEAVAAIEAIEADYEHHSRAASAIAREHFEAERVLGALLDELGVPRVNQTRTSEAIDVNRTTNQESEANVKPGERAASGGGRRGITKDSRVLALIPHFECEEWLDDALASLTRQTRPLDAIVVIDDASERPPVHIVERHPTVTLLHADRNVGPYRLVQQVIEETDYDAFLFQDADDWSAADRLERLLEAGERTGAELIGTQEIRVFCEEPEVAPIQWPIDVNALFAEKPTAFPLLHPTSIVARDLVVELGGFASGLRFSGDAEFLRRAQHVAKVVNVSGHHYYRRIRRNSLTTAQATGLQSPERKRVMEMLWERARTNAESAAAGEPLELGPIVTAAPVGLRRIAGPELQRPGAPAPERPAPPAAPASRPAKPGPPRPIFVIGADRSGVSMLACALSQHPAIPGVMGAEWLGELASSLPDVYAKTIAEETPAQRAKKVSVERFCRTFGRAAAALVGDKLDRWVDGEPEHTLNVPELARLFPEARFIHVVRDADAAITSLVNPPLGSASATGGTQIPKRLREKAGEDEAVQRWMRSVLAAVEAESALGAQRVLRVAYDDLLASGEDVVRRCLEFVEEPFAAECLWPLRDIREGVDADEAAGGEGRRATQAGLRAAARALSAELRGHAQPQPRAVAAAPKAPAQSGGFDRTAAGRVVMVTDHFPKFSETFFVNKFLELRGRGWDIHVVCNRSNKDQWEFFGDLRQDQDLMARLHATKDFEATIAELDPALVHFGYGTLALGRMNVPAVQRARSVVSFRGYDVNYHGLEDPHCYDDVWQLADMLHFVGRDTWARAQRRGCASDRPHAVITDAVDVSRFQPPVRDAGVLGTPERPLRIVSVGRLHWKKGHDFGLRAVRELLDRGVHATYRIIGDGPHLEATLFAVHDLALEQHVELMGARSADDVRDTLAWADTFLHPAVSEGFCVSAIEAQAMGLPVVCSDADGLGENVVDGETGFVVTRRDALALSQRLAQLAQDGDLRTRLGRSARLRAVSSFDATVQVDRFDRLYQELLRNPEPVAPALPAADVTRDAARDAARAQALAALRGEAKAAQARLERLRKEVFGREVVQRVHEYAAAELPADAEVLIVSRGDEMLVELPSGRGRHFPQAPEGHYAGHHPADSATAIEHLEDLRARGAAYLVIPATSDWWLEYYGEFTEHLDRTYGRIAERPDGYVVFSLAPREGRTFAAAEAGAAR